MPQHFTGTDLSWLREEARPFNKTLNEDQVAVIKATKSTAETKASAFFSGLASACGRLRSDARKAGELPAPPSHSLASEWRTMTTSTEAYAASCLTLTRSRSTAAFDRWNDTAKAMDSANAALNADVNRIRAAAPSAEE